MTRIQADERGRDGEHPGSVPLGPGFTIVIGRLSG